MKLNLAQIGERLKMLRKKMGFTQTKAAEQVGVSQDMVSRYEKGKSHPSPEYIFWMAGESGVSVDWILTGQTPEEYAARAAEADSKYGIGRLSKEEIELIRLFREVDATGKAAARAVLEVYKPKPSVKPE